MATNCHPARTREESDKVISFVARKLRRCFVSTLSVTVMMLNSFARGQEQPVFSADFLAAAEKIFQNNVGEYQLEDGEFDAHITAPSASPWHAQVKSKSTAPAAAGDVLIIKLDVRATAKDPSTQEAAVMLVAQQSDAPYEVDDETVVLATGKWTTHELPLRLKRNYTAGQMHVALNFGVCRQRVQVRNISCSNVGQRESTRGLRKPAVTYEGREPDAPWRAAAAQRIERIRKADLKLRVMDAAGKPIAGAKVQYKLRRHEFPFGTAVTTGRLLGDSPDDEKYREILKKYFNSAVFENDMKWPAWAGEHGDAAVHQARVDRAVDWLRANNIEVRGHCVVWPELQRLPENVRELVRQRNLKALRAAIDQRAADIVGRFAGRVADWDVINEPTTHASLQQLGGIDLLAECFRASAKADPAAKLYLNDFMLFSYGALNGGRIDELFDMAKQIKDSGAPIHGVGEQAHFDEVLVAPVRMMELLDRFQKLGLPMRITEFDIASEDEQLQADYLRDFLTVAFSHQNVDGFLFWGFSQKNHWKPKAAPWRNDWTRRPIADAYIELITRQWHTVGEATTDANGEISVRGFRGEYDAMVVVGAKSSPAPFKIGSLTNVEMRIN